MGAARGGGDPGARAGEKGARSLSSLSALSASLERAERPPQLPPGECRRLAARIGECCLHLRPPDLDQSLPARIASALATVCEPCVPQRRWNAIEKASHSLSVHESIVDECIRLLPSVKAPRCAGIAAISGFWMQRHPGHSKHSELRRALLDALGRSVIGCKPAPDAHVVHAFKAVLSSVTVDDFEHDLWPNVSKALRRSPEASLKPLQMLLSLLVTRIPPGLAETVTSELVPLAHHSNENRRALAHKCLQILAQRLESSEAASSALNILKRKAQGAGSGGRITVSTQRVGLFKAIASLADGCDRDVHAQAAADTSEWLVQHALPSETMEECKAACIDALSSLSAASRAAPRSCSLPDHLQACVTDSSDTLRLAALRCSRVCAQKIEKGFTPCKSLAQSISACARSGVAKAALRIEAALAAAALAAICARTDADKQDHCCEELHSIVSPDSCLLDVDVIYRLNDGDKKHVASLSETLNASASPDNASGLYVFRATLLIALHPRDEVSREALACLQSGMRRSAEAFGFAISALQGWMTAQCDEHCTLARPFSKAVEGSISRHSFQRCLRAIFDSLSHGMPLQSGEAGSNLARLMLMLYHDSASDASLERTKPDCWRQIARLSTHSQVRALITKYASAVSDALFEILAHHNEKSSVRLAAARAIGSVASFRDTPGVDGVYQRIRDEISRCGCEQLTEEDFLIWRTPEGMLSTDERSAFDSRMIENRSDKQSKRTDNESSDDDVDEPITRRTSTGREPRNGAAPEGKVQQHSQKKDPKQLAREQQMEREENRRAQIETIRDHLSLLCFSCASVASHCGKWSALNMRHLAYVMTLLPSELVGGDAAMLASTIILRQLPHAHMAGNAALLAAALRFVALNRDPDRGGADVETVCQAVHTMDFVVEENGCVDAQAVEVVMMPILRYVLLSAEQTALQPEALGIVAKIIHSDSRIPRRDVAALLWVIMERLPPAKQSEVHHLIQRAADGMSADESWALLDGALSACRAVRRASMEALQKVSSLAQPVDGEISDFMLARMFILCFDDEDDNREAARKVWDNATDAAVKIRTEHLVEHLKSPQENTRVQSSQAIAAQMRDFPDSAQHSLSSILALADAREWYTRWAVAQTLEEAAPHLPGSALPIVCEFLINALGDNEDAVREAAIRSGNKVIDAAGVDNVQKMLPTFESYFDRASNAEKDLGEHELIRQDRIRSGVVVFLGAIARHLHQSDPKVRAILQRMLQVLPMPSAVVQQGVASCLPPLIPFLSEGERSETTGKLLQMVTRGESYAERRGAAYGLAGLVKGSGISSLKSYGILDALKEAVENKQSFQAREGALFAFELFVQRLGRLFEPYIVQILPMLLVCFSDSTKAVRSAADGASKAMMANLSAQGVKLVLPALIKGLEDSKWRTKQGSVQLLGAMAHCSPKQLGSALPSVVPKLSKSLADTHPKVQAAAKNSLHEVGSVIRNPEIQQRVDLVLAAIVRPVDETDRCLDELMETTFVNSVDAPSLSLLVPVVDRGLRERQADMKKKAAKIVGNMCALVNDPQNMTPYIPQLLPELRKLVLDPIPEVRTVAAKAVSSLLQGLGEEQLGDLLDWLKENVTEGESNVERSGAAQCFAECLAVLGQSRVDEAVPDIARGCKDSRANVKDGQLELLHFLSHAAGSCLVWHLPTIFPCVLDGLSDEAEHVRDAALQAGKTIIDQFGLTQIDLLLPAIESGIVDESWRIRSCSVDLMGELLFKLSGATGRIQTSSASDEETVSSHEQASNLYKTLGEERHKDVLAALYLLRADVSKPVRTTADHIWKSVVVNTPKTLNAAMPHLIDRTMSSLSSGAEERAASARNNIAEIVRKLGERMLNTMLPLLKDKLESERAELRQGVCWAVAEIVHSCTRKVLKEYDGELVPMIRKGLCDADERVRLAAGDAFSNLIKANGSGAAADVVPHLLSDLEGSCFAIEGLKEVLKVQPDVLSSVLPKVVVEPLDEFKATVIGALAEVSGAALQSHLSKLLPPLLRAMGRHDATEVRSSGSAEQAEEDEEQKQKRVCHAAESSCRRVCNSVPQQHVYLLMSDLSRGLESEKAGTRFAAARAVRTYASETRNDLTEHMHTLMTTLTAMLADSDEIVVEEAWNALNELTSRIAREDCVKYVPWAREAIVAAQEKERRRQRLSPFGEYHILVPGFCLEKGLAPLVHVFLQGMLGTSDPDGRQAAAEGLGELLSTSTPEAVRPHVTAVCGPLIRLAREKFPWTVKAAILSTLVQMIDKGRLGLKPFIPQLHTTFTKCLSESSRDVRLVAADGLGELTALQTKADSVVQELVKPIGADTDSTSAEEVEACLRALESAFAHSGDKLQEATVESACKAQVMLLTSSTNATASAASSATGFAARYVSEETLVRLLSVESSEKASGSARCIASLSKRACSRVVSRKKAVEAVASSVAALSKDANDAFVRERAAAAAGWLCAGDPNEGYREKLMGGCVSVLNRLLSDKAAEVRRSALVAVKRIAKRAGHNALEPYMQVLAPQLAECLTERSAAVKAKAERCIKRVFNLPEGAEEAIKFVKSSSKASDKGLTQTAIKRLQRLTEDSDPEDDNDC